MRSLAISVWFLLLSSCVVSHAEYAPQVGTQHENFTLPRIDTRDAVSLAQFRGKKVLLIHFASW